MTKYLIIIDAGSSSLKLEIFVWPKIKSVWRASAERIGQKNSFIEENSPRLRSLPRQGEVKAGGEAGNKKNKQINFAQGLTYQTAFAQLVKMIPSDIFGHLVGCGHRVVALGPEAKEVSVIDKNLLKKIKDWAPLAPTHNGASLILIQEALKVFPKLTQWAVSDSAFFNKLPKKAQTYLLPEKISQRFGLKKIGYHGLAHQYLLKAVSSKLKKPENKINFISVHLGAGSSMALIQNGQAVDITFGFSALSGLGMATRPGDIDAYLPIYLQKQGYSLKEVEELLWHQSGWFGLCGMADFRDVLTAAGFVVKGWRKFSVKPEDKQKAKLALEVIIYNLQKALGSYLAVANSVEAIVWGGVIGYQSEVVRKLVRAGLNCPTKIKNLVVLIDEPELMVQNILKSNPKL